MTSDWLKQQLAYDPAEPAASAKAIAWKFFHNVKDLAGKPYFDHLTRVADRVAYCGEDIVAVAWLHDLVEDIGYVSLDDLRAAGWPEEIVQAVDAITQRKDEPLASYWTRVANNRIAWIVKLHGDMPDNNDPARRVLDTHRNNKIGNKYATAIDFFWHHQHVGFPEETVPCGPNV